MIAGIAFSTTPLVTDPAGSAPTRWRLSGLTGAGFLLLPTTAAVGSAFGSIAVAGVSLYPFKVLVMVLFGVVLATHRRSPRGAIPIVAASAFLAAWALFATVWTPAGAKGFQEATIFVFLVVLLLVATRSIGTNWFPALVLGWPVAIVATSVVAVWELGTGSHLSTEFVADRAGDASGTILSTFANPNNYGAFLALAIACSCIAMTMGTFSFYQRAFAAGAAALGLALLPLTASRLALLGLMAGLATLVVFALPARRGQALLIGVWASVIPAIVAVSYLSPQLVAKIVSIADRDPNGTSTSVREALILNGWDFFVRTRGMGVGPSGYEALMLSGDIRYPVPGSATNPHNMWIEILSEYGLVGIVTVAVMLGLALHLARPLAAPSWFGSTCLAAFVTYVIAAMTASSYVNDAVSWTFFSTFVAVCVWRSTTAAGSA